MRLIERYTLRTYLAPLGWCFGVFIGLYLVLDLLGHLDEILRYKVPFSLLITYYGTMVPLVFVQIAPFACLMATLYGLSELNKHLEIMAMRASGLDPWQIIRPLIWMALLLSAGVFLVNEYFAPEAALRTTSIKETRMERPADPDKPHKLIKEIQHLATYGQGHTLLYAQTFDPVDKVLKNIVILQHAEDLRLLRKVTAEKAVWEGERWKFFKGQILHYNKEGKAVGRPVGFETKYIEAGDRPEILQRSESQAQFMNSRDLKRYITRLESAGSKTVRSLRVDLIAKPATALACLVLTLIGIPFAIQSIRGGAVMGLSIGLGVGLGFYATNAIFMALGKGGLFPAWLAAWGAHILFGGLGLHWTWKKLA